MNNVTHHSPDDICIKWPRGCGLCQEDILEDQLVFVVRTDGQQRSERFRFNPAQGFADQDAQVTYRPCWNVICSYTPSAFLCHAECERLVMVGLAPALQVMQHTTPAPLQELRYRGRWLVGGVMRALEVKHPELPNKVRALVAPYLRSEYAVTMLNALEDSLTRAGPCEPVSLDQRVWASMARYEGRWYLSRLSNTKPEHGPGHIVFDPQVASRAHPTVLFLCENHLGVLGVQLGTPADRPAGAANAGGRWRDVPIPSAHHKLVPRTDVGPTTSSPPEAEDLLTRRGQGYKLREVRVEMAQEGAVAVDNTGVMAQVLYAPRYRDHRRVLLSPDMSLDMALVRFSYNRANTSGYSFTARGHGMRLLHAHRPGHELTCYQRTFDAKEVWLHLPMEQGEFIEEIWQRYEHLVFVTNKKRSLCAGPEPPKYQRPCQPTLVQLAGSAPHSFLRNRSPEQVCVVAFDELSTPHAGGAPPCSMPATPKYLARTDSEPFYFSALRLDNVMTIQLCRRPEENRIVGMLLQFFSGRRECVGEVRLDRLSDGIPAYFFSSMALGFEETDLGPVVRACKFLPGGPGPEDEGWFMVDLVDEEAEDQERREGEQANEEGGDMEKTALEEPVIEWLEFPLRGSLTWWFTPHQTQVYHGGDGCSAELKIPIRRTDDQH